MDPDQTAPIGAVCSGSTLFASILVRQFFAAEELSRRHFQMHFFFLGALRVKYCKNSIRGPCSNRGPSPSLDAKNADFSSKFSQKSSLKDAHQ